MLRLNKKVEYAILALIELEKAEETELLNVREIVNRAQIPGALAGKLLQTLNKANIVKSIQGINGGYKLSQSFESIRLKTLIEAIDGPIGLVDCLMHPEKCNSQSDCVLQSPMERIQAGIVEYLVNITMADIKRMYLQGNDLVHLETGVEKLF